MSISVFKVELARYALAIYPAIESTRIGGVTYTIKKTLSAARMGTYENAVALVQGGIDALDLYMWNAQISGALMVPLHIVEVSTRNAVDEALTAEYGSTWPWDPAFEGSLPSPRTGYKPRDDLLRARRDQPSTAKVIPELHFVFWQKMFTRRFDARIWSKQLSATFPTAPSDSSMHDVRRELHDALDQVRRMRNRIAHHEPIFSRNLAADVAAMHLLLKYRCVDTLAWMNSHETVTPLIASRPI